jgi:hypothetical protein
MSKQELYKNLLIKKKQRGLDDLYFFNKYILETEPERQKFLVDHVHGEWTTWYENSEKRIKMILVPRACFKSTFFTAGRTLQALCQNRNHRILIANATGDNAKAFMGEVKEHLTKNELLKELYGDFYDKSLKWNEDEIDIIGKALSTREPSVSATGVGGNLVSRHYSMIIADDLMNLENSATRYQVNKVIDWWKRAFALLDYDGEMIIIGTRWSHYDLYAYIKKTFKNLSDSHIKGAYNEDGSLYFPELLNEDKLTELKSIMGSYIFSSFYLNEPVDEKSSLIARDKLVYWGEENEIVDNDVLLPKNLNIFAVCDPAISQEADADESVILIVGVDEINNWYILEVRNGQWTVGELIEQLFAVFAEWNPQDMTVEVIGQAQMLVDSIYEAENERNIFLPLTPIKARPKITKQQRIRAVLQPRLERGKIFLKRDMFDLEEQILQFPRHRDDMIDALTDISEVGFEADAPEKTPEYKSSHFENLLIKQKENKSGPVDPFMGEYF